MASIRVSKRNKKPSRLDKQTLSDKKTECKRRSSVTLKTTPSTIGKKSAKVTNNSEKKSMRKTSIANVNKNNLLSDDVISDGNLKRSRRRASSDYHMQTRNSSLIVARESFLNCSSDPFDQSKTPISSISQSRKYVRKSVFQNSPATPMKDISNCYKNKQVLGMKTRKSFLLSNHVSPKFTADFAETSIKCINILAPNVRLERLKVFDDKKEKIIKMKKHSVSKKKSVECILDSPEVFIRCTRNSTAKSLSGSLKKQCTDTNKKSISEIQVSVKPSRKSVTFSPEITFEKAYLPVKTRKISANNKNNLVDNSLTQKSAECEEFLKTQKHENIKDALLQSPSKQTSAYTKSISVPRRRTSARLAEKLSTNQENSLNKNALETPVKNKNCRVGKKTSNYVSKNTLNAPRNSAPCDIEKSFAMKRFSLSPLRKTASSFKNCTSGYKKNHNLNNFQKKLKGNPVLPKMNRKAKSLNLSKVQLDDLIPQAACAKRKNKTANFKLPGKNTLKRKRMTVEAIKRADEGYEDDIFESKNFDNFRALLNSTPVSESILMKMSTPKFGIDVTPAARKKTPVFKDCFNPEDLAKRRKVAEEYIYRQNKNRKTNPKLDTPIPVIPEKKKLAFDEALQKVSDLQKAFNEQDSSEDEKEDSYFSFLETT